MEVKEFISSGILETYVVGVATEQEQEMVLSMLKHPEVKAELDAIEKAMGSYADAHGIQPPVYLKNKVLSAVLNSEKGTVININTASEKLNTYKWMAVAAGILLVISLGTNYMLVTKLDTAKKEIAQLNDDKSVLASDKGAIQTQYEQSQKDLAIFKTTDNCIVDLKGLEAAPNAKIMIYYNHISNEVHAEVMNLPKAPEGMEYQLWAINTDDKPVDLGMMGDMKSDTTGIHKMKEAPHAKAFAITLETKGGHPAPQGTMFAMGAVEHIHI